MLVESEGFRHVPGINCGGGTGAGGLHGSLMKLTCYLLSSSFL